MFMLIVTIINLILGILGIVGVFCGWATLLNIIVIVALIKVVLFIFIRIAKCGLKMGLVLGLGLPIFELFASGLLGAYAFNLPNGPLMGFVASILLLF